MSHHPRIGSVIASLLALAAATSARAQDADPPPAVAVEFGYTLDVLANTRGGLRREMRDLHLFEAALTLDGDRLPTLPDGATLHASTIYTTGGEFAAEVVGDAQVVSNIDAPEALRLYEIWWEQRLPGETGSFKFGVMDLNADFDVNATGALFMGSSHGVGVDLGQTGVNGPSIFPRPGLGARLQFRPAQDWSMALGVYEGTSGDADRPRSSALRVDDDEGALVIGELRRMAGLASFKLGAWAYTAEFDAIDRVGADEAPERLRRSRGAYALAEACLRGGSACRLRGFLRAGLADKSVNAVDGYLGAGVSTAPFATRPDDQLGLAVAVARFGDPYRDALRRDGVATDAAETVIELTYLAQVADGLSLQPNLQWVANPAGDAGIDDALVVGVRLAVDPLALRGAIASRTRSAARRKPGETSP